jgi:hypothetical protein
VPRARYLARAPRLLRGRRRRRARPANADEMDRNPGTRGRSTSRGARFVNQTPRVRGDRRGRSARPSGARLESTPVRRPGESIPRETGAIAPACPAARQPVRHRIPEELRVSDKHDGRPGKRRVTSTDASLPGQLPSKRCRSSGSVGVARQSARTSCARMWICPAGGLSGMGREHIRRWQKSENARRVTTA